VSFIYAQYERVTDRRKNDLNRKLMLDVECNFTNDPVVNVLGLADVVVKSSCDQRLRHRTADERRVPRPTSRRVDRYL